MITRWNEAKENIDTHSFCWWLAAQLSRLDEQINTVQRKTLSGEKEFLPLLSLSFKP